VSVLVSFVFLKFDVFRLFVRLGFVAKQKPAALVRCQLPV